MVATRGVFGTQLIICDKAFLRKYITGCSR